MTRNLLAATVAAAAMLAATPALAGPGGVGREGGAMKAGGAGRGGGLGAAGGGINDRLGGLQGLAGRNIDVTRGNEASRITDRMNLENRSTAGTGTADRLNSTNASRINQDSSLSNGRVEHNMRLSSKSLFNVSTNGAARANLNSSLARGALPGTLLPGLTTGLSVQSSSGMSIGTVTNVILTRNGLVAGIVVTASNGQTYVLPASSLSMSGNVVTANTSEAFENSRVPSFLLPGLTTGLTVNTSAGTTFGTITSIQTNANGSIRFVTVTDANGNTYRVPASSLTISGNVVTLNTAEAFERSGVPASFLPGLTAGLTVDTSAGSTFGTISQVVYGQGGTIKAVIVTAVNGQNYTIPASALTISGNVVTVANTEEAFERSGLPSGFLPGLTTGLTVNSSAGTTLGTVSQVVMGRNGTISAIIVTSSTGQTYILPANDLSMSGNVVTVTSG
jgi:ribosomal 30S subunit maturation factor RimM